jgi:hypothetical protein
MSVVKSLGLISAAIVFIPGVALAAGAFDGTWKQNLKTLKTSTKPYVYVVDGGNFTCSTCGPAYTVKADGTDQKVSGHGYDTSAVTVTPTTVVVKTKIKGKDDAALKFVAASDGNALDVEQTIFGGTAPVVVKVHMTRVGAATGGANPVSGTWQLDKVASISDVGMTQTFGITDDGFTESANGQSYDAKFDGKMYPIVGDPAHTMVKLKKIGPSEVVESDYVHGRLVEVLHMTVAADGKTIHVVDSHPPTGRVSRFVMDKQP